jgi:RES domain-containing protein
MIVYRIAKTRERASDLSGTGSFKVGGRWNNAGVFALYASENQSLAFLEVLAHVDESELPPQLYVATLEIDNNAPIYTVRSTELPKTWRQPENMELKNKGDRILQEKKYLAFKVRSAIIPEEFNFVLNPCHSDFNKYVKVTKIEKLDVDKRL